MKYFESPSLARRFLVVLPLAAAVASLAATMALLPPRVSIRGGEAFRLFSEGFFLTLGDAKLSADREVRLRLTNPRSVTIDFAIDAAPRKAGEVLELRTLRNGREVSRRVLNAGGATIGGTLTPGEPWARLVIEATPVSPGARPVYRVPSIRFAHSDGGRPWPMGFLGALIAGVLTHLLIRGVSRPQALLGAAATVLVVLALLTQNGDPLLPYRFTAGSRLLLALVASVAALLTGLLGPSRWRVGFALAAVVACLHGPSIDFGFVNEDFNFAHAWSASDLASTLIGSWDPTGVVEPYFRPLVSASLAFDFWLLGPQPWGYHAANLLLITVAAGLFARLLEGVGLARVAALGAAGLWLAHPLSASAIVWTNQRTDLLAVSFMLAATVFALRGEDQPAYSGLICLTLALLSKEIAVVTPVLVAAALLAKGERTLRGFRQVGWLAMLSAGYFLLWSIRFGQKLAPGTPRMENLGDEWWRRLASVTCALFLPPDYETWWTVGADAWPAASLAGSLLAPVLLFVFASKDMAARRVSRFGAVWGAIALLPLFLLREVDLHRLGLIPALGAAALFSSAIQGLLTRRPRLMPVAFVAAFLALAPNSRSSGSAWGPGGFRFGQLNSWRQSGGERWWNALTPAMQSLFRNQVEKDRAFMVWP